MHLLILDEKQNDFKEKQKKSSWLWKSTFLRAAPSRLQIQFLKQPGGTSNSIANVF